MSESSTWRRLQPDTADFLGLRNPPMASNRPFNLRTWQGLRNGSANWLSGSRVPRSVLSLGRANPLPRGLDRLLELPTIARAARFSGDRHRCLPKGIWGMPTWTTAGNGNETFDF